MIKANQLEHTRVDSLARSLGFVWDDGAYVAVRKVVATAPHTRRRHTKGAPMSSDVYHAIMHLKHGEEMNVTDEARRIGATRQNIYNRVYSHVHGLGRKSTHKYVVYQHHGNILVRRR